MFDSSVFRFGVSYIYILFIDNYPFLVWCKCPPSNYVFLWVFLVIGNEIDNLKKFKVIFQISLPFHPINQIPFNFEDEKFKEIVDVVCRGQSRARGLCWRTRRPHPPHNGSFYKLALRYPTQNPNPPPQKKIYKKI